MARKELTVEAINASKLLRLGSLLGNEAIDLPLEPHFPLVQAAAKINLISNTSAWEFMQILLGCSEQNGKRNVWGCYLLKENLIGIYISIPSQKVKQSDMFKAHCISSVLHTEGLSEAGIDKLWRRRYVNLGLGKLNPNKVLTPELLIQAVLTKQSNSRSRQVACQVMAQFARFAGLEVDFSPYSGSYSSLKQVKDLPSDQEIEESVAAFKNPQVMD